jgi:3-oxoacyl-[acyl-carrier protein] reductase
LVIGGSGAVGSQVVRALAALGVGGAFTYRTRRAAAEALAAEVDFRAHPLDVTDAGAVSDLVLGLEASAALPDILVYAAAKLDTAAGVDLDVGAWDAVQSVNTRGAFVVCRELARRMQTRGGGDIVLVGALDRAQSLPIPTAFAASQGLLAAMAMAWAKELGPGGIRINVVALGLLDEGLSLALDPKLRSDYLAFSALRRFGSTEEVARTIAWLAVHNTYLNGKVVSVNGGI